MAATRFARLAAALAIAAGLDGGDPLRPACRRARDRRWAGWRRPASPGLPPRSRSPLGWVAATRFARLAAALAIAAILGLL
jgi:hypothetical protein